MTSPKTEVQEDLALESPLSSQIPDSPTNLPDMDDVEEVSRFGVTMGVSSMLCGRQLASGRHDRDGASNIASCTGWNSISADAYAVPSTFSR